MTSFIAEIGSNHGGELDRAKALIKAAASVGFDAVKVQCFDPKRMFRPGTVVTAKHFPGRVEWLPDLHELAHSLDIQFGATICDPVYLNIDTVIRCCDFFKVGSYELLCLDLIRSMAATGKPLILSTGMASMNEVSEAFCVAHKKMRFLIGLEPVRTLTLMHCVSLYPCPVDKANLRRIQSIRDETDWVNVGYSDHTADWSTICRAVNQWKAEVVELHLDLDDAEGVETKHSLGPGTAQCIISELRMDGDGSDHPSKEEQAERKWRANPKDGYRPYDSDRED
jgi:N-acetylneuraminate synthase